MPYSIPRTVVYRSERDLLSHWLMEEGSGTVIIVDDIGAGSSVTSFLARRLHASLVKAGSPISSSVNVIVSIGGWASINWNKYVACTRVAGNIGLLGVSEHREKIRLISIPLQDIRFNYVPRLLSLTPSPSIIEHPCALPHEVLILSEILCKPYSICEITCLSETLGEEIDLENPWKKLHYLLKMYKEPLGIVDAVAESLTLLLGISYTTSLLASMIASIRNSAFKPKGLFEYKPLEVLLKNCSPIDISIENPDRALKDIEELVFRSLSMYHLSIVHPSIIRNTIRDALRLILDYSK